MQGPSDTGQETVNLAIMGPSGVGKSLVDKLLTTGVDMIDPYRARKNGARLGESVYVSPAMLAELLCLCQRYERRLLALDTDCDPDFGVYESVSFFAIRGKSAQCLLHRQSPNSNLRKIEIFAPTLAMMLSTPEVLEAINALKADHTVCLLLNPLSSLDSIRAADIVDGAGWKRENWEKMVRDRDEAQNQDTDEKDLALRIDHLPLECQAWHMLEELSKRDPTGFHFVDCRHWEFTEAKYLTDKDPPSFLAKMRSAIEIHAKEAGCWELIRPFFT